MPMPTKTLTESHAGDGTTIVSDSELNSEVSSTTSANDETQDKAKQEKARINLAILRKKTELIPKCINCLLFIVILFAPLAYIAFCFYTLTSNAAVVQENSMRTYKTCRLPGDIFYALISIRNFEKPNITDEYRQKQFAVFDRTKADLEDAFVTTRDVGNQKLVWEQQLTMSFTTFFPILNFTGWQDNLIQMRKSSVSLSSMANALLNFLQEFQSSNMTVEAQRAKNLVPYVDSNFNVFLDKYFVSIYENAYPAANAFDHLCTSVFSSDVSKSSQYEYILIGMFIVLLIIPIPITLIFVVCWYLLLGKQKAITSLFFFLPNEVSGGVYQEIKKKRNHEQNKGYASDYEPKLIFCYALVMGLFFSVVISAFIITLLCVLQSLYTLYSIKDASGTVYHLLDQRFLIGEYAKKHYATYPISTKMTDKEFIERWTTGKKAFYANWNNLRFGNGYSGLEALGVSAKAAASYVSRLIVTSETIQQLVDSSNSRNISQDYVQKNVRDMFSAIDESHLQILAEILTFLPYLMAQSSGTYTALLLFLVLGSAPLLFGVSIVLLCVVFDYEDDNYELLQQFNRVPPDTIVNTPAIKSYVFESSLTEANDSPILRILCCFGMCNKVICCFSKKTKAGTNPSETVGTKLFEEIYQTCPTPVIVCAQNGNVSFINTPAINVFEFDGPTDVVGVNVNRMFSVNSRMVLSSFFKNLQKNTDQLGRRKTILVKEEHLTGKRKNGQEFPCILSVALNSVKGQLMVPLFISDITSDEQHEKLIQAEKAKSEKLLLNILPAAVAKRLGDGEQLICESFPDVTCFFSDIVGFTNLSSKITAWELIKLLNDIVNGFDDIADKLSVEKIKTIGDAYFAVSGLHFNKNDHPQKMMLFAIRARALLEKVNAKALPASIRNGSAANGTTSGTSGDPRYANTNLSATGIQIRIGLHTGSVVGGVIGKSKFQYDVWGSTVNMASRMESTGIAGKIQVSRQTYERLHEIYKFEERDKVKVKGIGDVTTYVLDDSKIPADAFDNSMVYEFENQQIENNDFENNSDKNSQDSEKNNKISPKDDNINDNMNMNETDPFAEEINSNSMKNLKNLNKTNSNLGMNDPLNFSASQTRMFANSLRGGKQSEEEAEETIEGGAMGDEDGDDGILTPKLKDE